jgi:hypothetical protein
MGKVRKYQRFRNYSANLIIETLEEYTTEELVRRYVSHLQNKKLTMKGIPTNRSAGQVLGKDPRFVSVSYGWLSHAGKTGQSVNEWFLNPEYL